MQVVAKLVDGSIEIHDEVLMANAAPSDMFPLVLEVEFKAGGHRTINDVTDWALFNENGMCLFATDNEGSKND